MTAMTFDEVWFHRTCQELSHAVVRQVQRQERPTSVTCPLWNVVAGGSALVHISQRGALTVVSRKDA